MISLDEILDQHFFPNRKNEIKSIINDFGFERILINSYNKLIAIESDNAMGLMSNPNSITTIVLALNEINRQIIPISDIKRKDEVKTAISEVSIRLWLQIIGELGYELQEIAPQFNNIMELVCELQGYDFNDFKSYFNIEEVVSFSKDLSGASVAIHQRATAKNSLAWQIGNPAKFELIDQLKKKMWLRKPNKFSLLFENPESDLQIIWDSNRFEELSYLFYLLHNNEIIGINGNRGFFSSVEKHIVDFDNRAISKGRLKTLNHRIKNNLKKYDSRISPIFEIISIVKQKARN